MAHGTPDWAEMAPKTVVYSGIDLAELAVRLGSIVSYDRRGDVVWLDDFESGLVGWDTDAEGIGAKVVWSADTGRSGAFSAKLTLGDDEGDEDYIHKLFGLPYLSKVGFELSFVTDQYIDYLEWRLRMFDGSYRHEAAIRLYEADNELQYYDSGGVFRHLAYIGGLWRFLHCWHTFKFVIDLTTHEYVRVLLNDNAISMTGIAYGYSESEGASTAIARYTAKNGAAGNRSVYADDAIFTQNEP